MNGVNLYFSGIFERILVDFATVIFFLNGSGI